MAVSINARAYLEVSSKLSSSYFYVLHLMPCGQLLTCEYAKKFFETTRFRIGHVNLKDFKKLCPRCKQQVQGWFIRKIIIDMPQNSFILSKRDAIEQPGEKKAEYILKEGHLDLFATPGNSKVTFKSLETESLISSFSLVMNTTDRSLNIEVNCSEDKVELMKTSLKDCEIFMSDIDVDCCVYSTRDSRELSILFTFIKDNCSFVGEFVDVYLSKIEALISSASLGYVIL